MAKIAQLSISYRKEIYWISQVFHRNQKVCDRLESCRNVTAEIQQIYRMSGEILSYNLKIRVEKGEKKENENAIEGVVIAYSFCYARLKILSFRKVFLQ